VKGRLDRGAQGDARVQHGGFATAIAPLPRASAMAAERLTATKISRRSASANSVPEALIHITSPSLIEVSPRFLHPQRIRSKARRQGAKGSKLGRITHGSPQNLIQNYSNVFSLLRDVV
jgi:hypothetical protein